LVKREFNSGSTAAQTDFQQSRTDFDWFGLKFNRRFFSLFVGEAELNQTSVEPRSDLKSNFG
jgi:hypothetical protein